MSSALGGSQSPFYRMAALNFDDLRQLQAAMDSVAGRNAVADLPNFANGGVTTIISEIS